MEILYRGIPPHERTYTTNCNNCATKFRFQKKEANFFGTQRDGNTLSIQCPVCDQMCYVDPDRFDK